MGEVVSAETVKQKFMPMLQTMHKDPVANVRLNVAKTLQALQKQIKQLKENQDHTRQILKNLSTDKDIDVKHFAERA